MDADVKLHRNDGFSSAGTDPRDEKRVYKKGSRAEGASARGCMGDGVGVAQQFHTITAVGAEVAEAHPFRACLQRGVLHCSLRNPMGPGTAKDRAPSDLCS
jgi:hypothetical protein